MEVMLMKEETLKVIKDIYEQTSAIFNLYTLLIRMELLNKVSTKEYQNAIQILNLCIEKEKKLYNYFKENPLEVIPAFIFVSKNEKTTDDYILASEQNPFDIITARISRYFYEEKTKNPLSFLDCLDYEEIYCIADEPEDIGFQYLYEMIPNIRQTAKRRMASYLEKVIQYQNDSMMKEFFIKAKYYLSFLDIKLEDYYIKYSFQNIPNRFDEEIKVSTIVNQTTEENLKNLYADRYLKDAITALFDIKGEYDLTKLKPKTVTEMGLNNPEKYQMFLYNLGQLELSIYYFSKEELQFHKCDLYDKVPKFMARDCNSTMQIYKKDINLTKEQENMLKDLKNRLNEATAGEATEIMQNIFEDYGRELLINQTKTNVGKRNYYLYALDCVFRYVTEIKREANRDIPKRKKEK